MADDPQQERTEDATTKRRDDFRKKGQVAQSKEVNSALLLSCFVLFWVMYGNTFFADLSSLVKGVLRNAATTDITPLSIVNIATMLFRQYLSLMAPIFLLALLVGFFASFMQIGWLFTGKPLTPDFSKLDPIKGMGRFVSKRSGVELVKSLSKVILVAWVAWQTIYSRFDGIILLVDQPATDVLRYLGDVAYLVLLKVCGIMILLAMIDFLFVRWEMEQKMKMTKQEQKEEHKEAEGDPQLKAQIRARQQEMARRRMMAEVPKADVVVTNPTHISVALRYDRDTMDSPVVVAKGADHVAMKIREIAKENSVPMVENVPVARALHKVDLGAPIPEAMFKAVAEILAYVYNLKK